MQQSRGRGWRKGVAMGWDQRTGRMNGHRLRLVCQGQKAKRVQPGCRWQHESRITFAPNAPSPLLSPAPSQPANPRPAQRRYCFSIAAELLDPKRPIPKLPLAYRDPLSIPSAIHSPSHPIPNSTSFASIAIVAANAEACAPPSWPNVGSWGLFSTSPPWPLFNSPPSPLCCQESSDLISLA